MEAQGAHHCWLCIFGKQQDKDVIGPMWRNTSGCLAEFRLNMTGWKMWVQNQTKGAVIVLSGNSYHSNQTLPCTTSSSKSFHCVSFPRSFCYSRCVKDFSCSKRWLYRFFPMGLCAMFSQLYLFLHVMLNQPHMIFSFLSPCKYWECLFHWTCCSC